VQGKSPKRDIARLGKLSNLKRDALWSTLAQARKILLRQDSTYTISPRQDIARLIKFDSLKVQN